MLLSEQIGRMNELAGVQYAPTANAPGKLWYRGYGDSEFNGNEADSEGPGIYFTDSEQDARHYGHNVLVVRFKGREMPWNKYRGIEKHMEQILRQKEDWESDAQNWSQDPERGLKIFIQETLKYNDTARECFQQIWIDWFRYDEMLFIQLMSKIWDAFVVYNRTNGDGSKGSQHMIVYNKSALEVVEDKKGQKL
jgi:hypothetical protein